MIYKINKKNILIFALALPLVIIVILFYQYNYYVKTPVNPENKEKIAFNIKKGQSIKKIAQNLREKELIKSDSAFYLYTKWSNFDEKVLFGRFKLSQSMNVPDILNVITDLKAAEFVITIQEGITIKNIEQKLIDLGLLKEDEFQNAVKNFQGYNYYTFLNSEKTKNLSLPLEGYIYPDTYFLDPTDFKNEDLIYKALDNFEIKWNSIDKTASPILKKYSIHEIITTASIIENEVSSENDRKTVSGILWKRLENNWPLGADATLLYNKDNRKITKEDLNTDSPYNTRKKTGLPPGPINNPSISSIKAALFPEESPYWFYLTTPDTGEVIYSKTNKEHNLNKAKYLN